MRSEWPSLDLKGHYSGDTNSDGRFAYAMAYDSARVGSLEESYLELGKCFDLDWIDLAVVNSETFVEGKTGLFDDALVYTISFEGDSPDTVKAVHFKPVFVKLVDGATISSATPGVTLAEGDVRFTERGDGFWDLHVSGSAAEHGSMVYYIHNESAPEITLV